MASDIDAIVKAIQEGFAAQDVGAQQAAAAKGEKGVERARGRAEDLREEAKEMEAQLVIERKLHKSGKDRVDQYKKEGEINAKRLQAYKELKEAGVELKDADEEGIKKLKEKNKTLDENTKAQEKNNKNLEKSIEGGKAAGKAMGGLVAVYGKGAISIEGFATGLRNAWKAMDSFQGVGMMLRQVILSLVDTIISFALMVDESTSSIMKSTGVSREHASAMLADAQAMSRFSIATKDLGASFGSLRKNYTDLSFATVEQQQAMANTGAMLQRHGVALDDYSQSIQKVSKFMGVSGQAAQDYSVELVQFAKDIGIDPGQMIGDLNANAAAMAKLGHAGRRAFMDLAITAKITGLEVSKLLAIVDKFDTFEGAATQAGKLNAAMGGNFVNAMDLMMATDPAERFGMIRDSILDAGLSFDSMTYYQRKFFAEAAGMSDVGDLAMALSGDMSQLAGASNQTTADYKRLNDQTKALNSITEEFKAIMMSLIPVMDPLIQALKDLAADTDRLKAGLGLLVDVAIGLVEVIIWMIENWKKALGIFLIVKAFVIFLTGYFQGFAISLHSTAAAQLEVGATAPAASAGLASIAASAKAAAVGMLAFGAAILMIGGGIALAAEGFSSLAEALYYLDGPALEAFTTALLYFGIGMLVIVGVLAALVYSGLLGAAALGLAAFGGAILLIGAGVALAGFGIGLMAEGIGKMFKAIDPVKILAFQTFIGVIALQAAAMVIGAIGLALMAVAMGKMASALSGVPTEALQAYATFFTALASMEASTFTTIASGLKKINEQISKLPTNKALALKTTMESVVMAHVVTRTTAPARMAASAAGTAGASTGRPHQVTLKLEMDGKPIADKVLTIVNGIVQEGARNG